MEVQEPKRVVVVTTSDVPKFKLLKTLKEERFMSSRESTKIKNEKAAAV